MHIHYNLIPSQIITSLLLSSTACQCNQPYGSRFRRCDKVTGQCECRRDITGRTCDTCVREGFYGPTTDIGCKRCECVAENTIECNNVSCCILYSA